MLLLGAQLNLLGVVLGEPSADAVAQILWTPGLARILSLGEGDRAAVSDGDEFGVVVIALPVELARDDDGLLG